MKRIIKYSTLFIVYGLIYFIIECLYKGKLSDWRMFVLAGFIGIIIGLINNLFDIKTDFILQCIFGMLIATLSEAIGGFYWNLQCGLHIWDYSSLPFSFIGGQINLFFSLIWMFLSGIVIILDDILRWKLYKEERPKYYVHGKLILKSNGYWYFSKPKYNSFRTIELDDVILEALKKEHDKQLKARAYFDKYYNHYYSENEMTYAKADDILPMNKVSQEKSPYEVNFVCRREDGSYISARTTQHTSSIIHKQLHFPQYDTHSLRHTHGTILYENGASFMYIKERLGHKNLQTTIEIYTNHYTDTINKNGNIVLNNAFSKENV